jgi:putative hydrolase of the HAD superfamily
VKMVLFDAVGTLIAPRPSVAEVYHAVGQRHGSRLSPDDVARRFHDALAVHGAMRCAARCPTDWTTSPAREREAWRDVVGRVFDDVPQCVEAIFSALWDHFAAPTSWQVDPEVAPLWRQLRQSGLRFGISSNFDDRLNEICRQLDPLAEAEVVFHSAQLGARKPGRAFFDAIQRQLGLPPSALMMVGDDWSADYYGALQAGWQAVWLDRNAAPDARRLPHRITQLGQLVDQLRAE